ncbi:MAG TPA: BadF/BadG/BcrA/BcrD ATPase family protein [bacterium]|nr:BadF/BadG/BcrA/BcrD ATPase family protein [bacterium]
MKHVLAVDGGNSKTLAAVADGDGRVLAVARGGGSNYQTIGIKASAAVLSRTVKAALRGAGLKRVDAACYGLAGADRDKDFAVFEKIIRGFDPAKKSVLVNDTLLALRAGTDGGVGVALIGGAGSNCIGMDRKGRVKKAWGLGPLTGDKANAGALALDAVVAAMKGVDGRGPKTALEKKLRRALGVRALDDVIEFEFHDGRRDLDFGALAPLVFEAANEGDREALRILREHGEAAGEAALAVLRGLFSPRQSVQLVLGGSVLQRGGNPALVRAIFKKVAREFPRARLTVLTDPPVLGAVLRAMDEARIKTAAETRRIIRDGLDRKLKKWSEENGIK